MAEFKLSLVFVMLLLFVVKSGCDTDTESGCDITGVDCKTACDEEYEECFNSRVKNTENNTQCSLQRLRCRKKCNPYY